MKRKVIALGAVVLGLVLVFAQEVRAEDAKIAYINLSLVFDSYDKTKDFDRELQVEAETKRDERDKIVGDVKKYRDELELLSPDKRAQMQQRMDEKVQELQAFDRDSRLSLRKHRDTMIRDILQEIDEVVQDYGRKEDYDYILNDRVLLFKREDNDISQEIIRILNV